MAKGKTKFVKPTNKGGAFSRQVTKSGPTAPPIPADSRMRSDANDPLKQRS
jgi:hypothetical protein